MIDPKIFYSTFQINYFDYKQTYLTHALNNFKEFHQENRILKYSEKDFLLTIKSDIRQTLFQAIETVFEILFALTPDKNGYILDKDILRILSKSNFPYNRISKIAENAKELDFFGKEILLSNGETALIGEYIFYFGLYSFKKNQDKIKDSIEAIKTALHILAVEFSDRKEYNCYKHGLRIIPAMTAFKLMKSQTKEKIVTWDLSDSMTYYLENDKLNKLEFVTKVFDTERDIKLTRLCSDLLWNIIKIRDVAFNKLIKKEGESLDILFFDKDLVKTANKMNVPIQNLRFTTSIKN